ncbi:T9SS type A sorting domain-containing protein [Polluticoccus soli]|uniref:T9SS type A sorting domain-containing protein n=1 Tax=Polluticoccus soli TaxID=3034150 RepID=UPI0023E09047|nr:T9SS type A sorting domain-containing protein [Flavipsychrobacter sp. JY13-12]
MHGKLFILIAMIMCLLSTKISAQCPTRIENYTSGSASATSCPGVNGNATAANFAGTSYATVPSSTKAGNFQARWGSAPSPIPAIKAFYDDSVSVADTAGPASTLTVNGSNNRVNYCLYGSTPLPTSTTYSLIFVNPQTDTILYTCSFNSANDAIAQPTITTQPQSVVGCVGYKATFTVAATAVGGQTITYRWQKNGVNIVGATSTTFTINSVAASDTGTNIYRAVIVQNNGAIQVSKEVSLTLNKEAIWTGATSTNWKTASNWSPATIPDSTKQVYIRNTTNKPNIAVSDTGRCKCLTLDTGFVTVVGRLEIAGRINLFASGLIKASTGTVAINGTTVAQTIPASSFENNTVNNLVYANATGVTIGGATNFTGTLTRVSGILTTGGFLTLKSTSSGTARVAPGVAGGISGDVTVERYVPVVPGNQRAWRLLAPVTSGSQTILESWQENATGLHHNPNPGYGTIITCGPTFNISDGFDTVMANMSILAWSVSNQSLTSNPVSNTNTKQLSSEPAYFLYMRGDRTVLPGASTSEATATTLRSKGTLKQGDQAAIPIDADQFVALGNPYASHIDFSTVSASDRVNLGNRFWLWDPRLVGSYGLGGYVMFDGGDGFFPSVTGGSYNSANSLIPMGMGFFVKATGGNGSFTAREAQKAASSSNVGFKTTGNAERLRMHLSYMKDGITPVIADGTLALFNSGFASGVDADDAGKPENMGENIGIVRDNEVLTLEARPNITASDTLNLKLWKLRGSSKYRFTMQSDFNTPDLQARLVDRFLQTQQAFSLSQPVDIDFTTTGDAASLAADRFYIAFSIGDPVNVNDPVNEDEITVYPNPTDAQNININLKNAAPGEYHFSIIDVQGKTVYRENYEHAGHSLTKRLDLHTRLVSGNYFIAITKDGQELSTRKLIINK